MLTNRQIQQNQSVRDRYQTPKWPVDLLVPFIPPGARIWEPCCGERRLVNTLEGHGFEVIGTDIVEGHDFLWDPELPHDAYDIIITNPPFSVKNAFVDRVVGIGKPYALLLPLAALEARDRQGAWAMSDMQLVMLPKRVHYHFPVEADEGQPSKANFPSAWFTSGLEVPGGGVTFADSPALGRKAFVTRKNKDLLAIREASIALHRMGGLQLDYGQPPEEHATWAFPGLPNA